MSPPAPVYPFPQSRLSKFLYGIVTFIISHLFLFPILAAAVITALLRFSGNDPRVVAVLVGLLFAYAGLYLRLEKATKTGSLFNPDSAFCSFWLGCHSYFPVRTLMFNAETQRYEQQPSNGHQKTYTVDSATYIFAMAPHGPLPVGAAVLRPQLSRWPWLTRRIIVGAADAVFALPIVRELFLLFGSVRADKATCLSALKRGQSVLLLPGGIREQLTVCDPSVEDVVVLSDRKGFVRLALETGSPLVPVYVFNERKAYRVNNFVTSIVSTLLKRLLNVGIPLVVGRWLFTLMPFAVPVTLVFGRPIPVPLEFKRSFEELEAEGKRRKQAGNVPKSDDENNKTAASEDAFESAVATHHLRFCEELRRLYAEHQDQCGHKGVALVIK